MPLIGLLSDSHGRHTTTHAAVSTLIERGARRLIHLGDIGTFECVEALAAADPDTGQQLPAHLVYGNTDWDLSGMTAYARDLGLEVDHPVGRLEVDGKTLIYQHGHEEQAMRASLKEAPDYLCHGHTHRAVQEKRGPTTIINPGALFRASKYTVAVLDPASGEVSFYPVDPAKTAVVD